MPNHVYNIISVEEKYADKLEEIVKVGLCKYYKPMPKELDVTSPNRDVALAEKLTKKYGHADWYSWRAEHWGTKWGCYDTEDSERGIYRYTTAWSPVNDQIIELLLKDIPSLTFFWEEEQGFGQEEEYLDGEKTHFFEWDLPSWEDTKNDEIQFLSEDYTNTEGTFSKGYYLNYNLHEYLAEELEDAVHTHNNY